MDRKDGVPVFFVKLNIHSSCVPVNVSGCHVTFEKLLCVAITLADSQGVYDMGQAGRTGQ